MSTSDEKLDALQKQVQQMMEMFAIQNTKIAEQAENNKRLKEKLEKAKAKAKQKKNKQSSSSMTLQEKEIMKESIQTQKDAKVAVPILTTNNFKEFRGKMTEVFKSKPNIRNLLKGVGMEPTQTVVKKEEEQERAAREEKEALSSQYASYVSNEEATNFFIWLTTKLDKTFSPLVEAANKIAKPTDQLKNLWGAVIGKFIVNSITVREQKMNEWGDVRNITDEEMDSHSQRVLWMREEINELYYVVTGTTKLDDDDVIAKLKRLNPYNMEICQKAIEAMEVNREVYKLDEWLNMLKKKVTEAKLKEQAEGGTGYVNMARTNNGLPERSTGDNFRTVLTKDQSKEIMCFNFDGRPGSCRWERNCKFKHEMDKRKRDSWLAKIRERKEQRRRDRERDQERRNKPADATPPPSVNANVVTSQDAVSVMVAVLNNMNMTLKDMHQRYHQTNAAGEEEDRKEGKHKRNGKAKENEENENEEKKK